MIVLRVDIADRTVVRAYLNGLGWHAVLGWSVRFRIDLFLQPGWRLAWCVHLAGRRVAHRVLR